MAARTPDDQSQNAADNGSEPETTAAIFNQDAEGAGADDSAPEPEAPVEEPAESVPEAPSPTEVILTRMAEISVDPDGDVQLRNNKLRDIQANVGQLPDAQLGKFCAFVVANGNQFEQRTAHYVVKLLLARHPKVIDQDPALPGNIIGGIARKIIEGEYTWETLVVRPPRPRPEPEPASPRAVDQGGSSEPVDDGGHGEGAGTEVGEPVPEPDPDPVPTSEPSEDPILATLQRQNAEMAALGF